jgi:predicted nucleic acid-binding Zn ribbon protein
MRKSNTQPLGNIIQEYLKVLDIESKLHEVRLIEGWPEVVGLVIAKKTARMYVKNRVLFVYLNSSVVRSELLRIRDELLKALNEKAGKRIIDEIVLR